MARIELRNTNIYLQDGLAGTAAVNDAAGVAIADLNVDIDTVVLNTAITTVVPVGARFTLAGNAQIYTVTARTPSDGTGPVTNIVFTPAAVSALADDGVITFLPQRLEIKVGEGDLSWSESREFIYDLDRSRLDTVRQGDDQPISVDMAFTFEYVTSQSGRPVTPVEALKKIGGASEWVNSATDPCEPYAVDVYVRHCIPCGTDQDQDFLMPDFRYESLEYSVADASISVSGQCNATSITSTRADLC